VQGYDAGGEPVGADRVPERSIPLQQRRVLGDMSAPTGSMDVRL
jgi:hypothetical protein